LAPFFNNLLVRKYVLFVIHLLKYTHFDYNVKKDSTFLTKKILKKIGPFT